MRSHLIVAIVTLLVVGSGTAHRNVAFPEDAAKSKGWIIERSEGEKLVRRPRSVPLPSSVITIKIDRKNGGSEHMVMLAEELPPGKMIPRHKHFDQDEILLLQTSSAHVWLGESERDVSAGAAVFIPANTWIRIKNTGQENLSLIAVFSAPGFEEYLRCTSAPEGQKLSMLSDQEWKECQHQGHSEFQGVPNPPSK